MTDSVLGTCMAFWIGNEFVAPHGSAKFDVINPATEELIASVPVADATDVDRAVAAARKVIDDETCGWAGTTGAQRAVFMRAMASKIEERTDALARLEAEMTGKPLPETVWDVEDVVGECRQIENMWP